MNNSKNRFEIQINKIKTLLANAKRQENPALWLFLNDLRTPFFMLEGLSKMYANLHDKKDFSKIKEQAKEIEDALGAVDYFVAFQKEFAANTKIPSAIKQHIETKANESLQTLNQLLQNENWLNGKRIAKIELRLKNASWLNEEMEIKGMKNYYEDEIKEIIDFVKETTYTFDNVEEDVHELRRKIRWLSIYPQALNGVAKLVPNKTTTKAVQKYLTKAVVNSPFNQLNPVKELKHHLLFNKDNFLALSWMIAELGNIKDRGLRIKVIADALQSIEFIKIEEAEQKAMQLLGNEQKDMPSLLQKASAIVKTYISENLLINLIKK